MIKPVWLSFPGSLIDIPIEDKATCPSEKAFEESDLWDHKRWRITIPAALNPIILILILTLPGHRPDTLKGGEPAMLGRLLGF